MNLQVVNIANSEVKFLDETKDPLKQAEAVKEENASLTLQIIDLYEQLIEKGVL